MPRNKPARQTVNRSCHFLYSLPASGKVPVYKDQIPQPLLVECGAPSSPGRTTCPFTIFDMVLSLLVLGCLIFRARFGNPWEPKVPHQSMRSFFVCTHILLHQEAV
jgi:hypothetical protein